MYNSIIIGGGVAGLTAAMYLARANAPCLIIESKFWGGQTALLNKVSNYPAVKETSGYEIANTLYQQVKELSVDMKNEIVTKLKKIKTGYQITTNKGKYTSHNVIIATGAKTTQLGLQDEKRFVGKGVSYCAICDGFFFKNKAISLIGNSNYVISECSDLINISDNISIFTNGEETSSELSNYLNIKYISHISSDEIKNTQLLSKCKHYFQNKYLISLEYFVFVSLESR